MWQLRKNRKYQQRPQQRAQERLCREVIAVIGTVGETGVGTRASQSTDTLPSASGSSPTPLSVYWYLSPVLRLERVSSPSFSPVQSGAKSSG